MPCLFPTCRTKKHNVSLVGILVHPGSGGVIFPQGLECSGAILTLGALADCLQEEAIVQVVWMSVVLPANVHHVAVDLPAVAQISHHLVNGSTEWLEQL